MHVLLVCDELRHDEHLNREMAMLCSRASTSQKMKNLPALVLRPTIQYCAHTWDDQGGAAGSSM